MPGVGDQSTEFPKRLPRSRIGDRHGATPCRFVRDIVGALEPDTSTHSGDRIDDEADVPSPHSSPLMSSARTTSPQRATSAAT